MFSIEKPVYQTKYVLVFFLSSFLVFVGEGGIFREGNRLLWFIHAILQTAAGAGDMCRFSDGREGRGRGRGKRRGQLNVPGSHKRSFPGSHLRGPEIDEPKRAWSEAGICTRGMSPN